MSDVQALQDSFQGDLTSFQGMLNYERSLRTAMGKLKHKWPAGLKVPHAMMLAHNFIPEEEAPKAPGWDPVNPNGFGPAKPNATNPMGEPGYTYTTNGEDLGVEQKGPGYYQVLVYLRWCVFASSSRAANSSPFREKNVALRLGEEFFSLPAARGPEALARGRAHGQRQRFAQKALGTCRRRIAAQKRPLGSETR